MATPILSDGIFPRRVRQAELVEVDKEVRWSGIPETIDDLYDSRTIRNDELDPVLQSEAFDLGFSVPDIRTNRRLSVF